jgi:hypothetical protein
MLIKGAGENRVVAAYRSPSTHVVETHDEDVR